MAVHLSAASIQPVAPPVVTTSFDERWRAWQARGVAHERAVRRKMLIAAPVVAAVGAAIYLMFIR
jgi:hypothetical protein